jgi:hypothetical protein
MHCYCLLLHCYCCIVYCCIVIVALLLFIVALLLLHCYCCIVIVALLLWTYNIVAYCYNIVGPEVLRCWRLSESIWARWGRAGGWASPFWCRHTVGWRLTPWRSRFRRFRRPAADEKPAPDFTPAGSQIDLYAPAHQPALQHALDRPWTSYARLLNQSLWHSCALIHLSFTCGEVVVLSHIPVVRGSLFLIDPCCFLQF